MTAAISDERKAGHDTNFTEFLDTLSTIATISAQPQELQTAEIAAKLTHQRHSSSFQAPQNRANIVRSFVPAKSI